MNDFLKRDGMTGLEFVRSVAASGRYPTPMAETLRLNIAEVEHGRVKLAIHAEDHLISRDRLHGGAIAAYFDSAMGNAVNTALGVSQRCTTIDLRVTYMKGVPRKAVDLSLEAKLLQLRRRIALTEASLHGSDGHLFAHATATFFIHDLAKLPVR